MVVQASLDIGAYDNHRTKLCDPMFTNDTARINEIPKKAFGRLVAANITDVSHACMINFFSD